MANWDSQARSQARQGNLFGALVCSAISAHYLQDVLAAGHMATARKGLHDAFALAIHDEANSFGARFVLESSFWTTDRDNILREMNGIDGITPNSLELLRKSYNVRLHGDSFLDRNAEAKALILLIQTNAILNVFRTYYSLDEPTAILQKYTWESSRLCKGVFTGPNAGIDGIGRYVIPVSLTKEPAPVAGISFLSESSTAASYPTRLGIGGEFGVSGFPAGGNFARDCQDGSVIKWWENIELALGARWTQNHNDGSLKYSARFIKAFPFTESSISAYFFRDRHDFRGGSIKDQEWRSEWGLRGDLGFSVATGFVEVGRGHGFNATGSFVAQWEVNTGITFIFPMSRIPRIGGWFTRNPPKE
ncbi:hypothetical protein [Geothrix sp. PMB-07]|uniref:hypothetical protein n=1 Tax=Geothrix sp. PMB-07 TaxID=3068640 RepID=UPI002740E7FC|nr:hypothetical protein [Geothrix sp. PMB-07]WLT30654.1 hypothetical protein Q9293_13110 [Geothrix sp. PMB-07]